MPTVFVDDRAMALRIGYKATYGNRRKGIPWATYKKNVSNWIVLLITCGDGEPAGAFYRRGNEFHMAILPRWHRRWATKAFIQSAFDYPFLFTGPLKRDSVPYGLLVRLGFCEFEDTGILFKDKR